MGPPQHHPAERSTNRSHRRRSQSTHSLSPGLGRQSQAAQGRGRRFSAATTFWRQIRWLRGLLQFRRPWRLDLRRGRIGPGPEAGRGRVVGAISRVQYDSVELTPGVVLVPESADTPTAESAESLAKAPPRVRRTVLRVFDRIR